MSKNKSYSNEYKFKVVIEMLRGEMTIAEIISKYQVPRSVIHRWKKQLLENGSQVFNSKNQKQDIKSVEVDKLHATIGRLKVENDFLHQVSARLK